MHGLQLSGKRRVTEELQGCTAKKVIGREPYCPEMNIGLLQGPEIESIYLLARNIGGRICDGCVVDLEESLKSRRREVCFSEYVAL